SRPSFISMKCPELPRQTDLLQPFRKAFAEFQRRTKLDVTLVDAAKTICPDDECKTIDDQGHILYTDGHHLSIYGSRLVVPHILAAVTGSPELLRSRAPE
ncbi:MAG TPA: SGNH hydrolase domain-containing protein, partial [Blastocatellia bacterium]|nr:SGNH hydrolase domain-containing protein [Blastocatellia bacterium]